MSVMSQNRLFLQEVLGALKQIRAVLGDQWFPWRSRMFEILKNLQDAKDEDTITRLVDKIIEEIEGTPAEDLVRQLLRKAMETGRDLRFRGTKGPVRTPGGETVGSEPEVSSSGDWQEVDTIATALASHLQIVPTRDRRINAWIGERETGREKPLVVGQPYTLKLNVGEPRQGSLLIDNDAKVPLSEIPDGGMETVWKITSDTIELAVAQADHNVEVDVTDAPTSWAATFKLLIRKGTESEIRLLRITPRVVRNATLDIVILSRNTLYRQFGIELMVEETSSSQEIKEAPVVKVVGDVEHVPLRYTGLIPPREWQTPTGTLSVCVIGNGKAIVNGEVWNPMKQERGVVNTRTDWTASLPKIAGPIKNLRDQAEKFRTTFSDELNNIDRLDLEGRLSHFKGNTHTFWEDNRGDTDHKLVWEQKIASSDELRELAYHGYALYKIFFPDNTRLRQWLDNLEPGWRINLAWSESIDPNWIPHVPWGLLYTRPPEPGQPVDPMFFWGLRYRFNYQAHDSDIELSPALGDLNTTKSAYGFYWGNDLTDQEMVEEVQWQQTELAKWNNHLFVPDSTLPDSPKQQVLALFNKPPLKPTPLLYLFCVCDVGDGNKPVLQFRKTKSADDNIKQTDLSQTPFASEPLVFINACVSAASDPYIANELERTFFERGCRSYLGTEVKVPIRLASRFANIFYRFFFRDFAPEPIAAGEAVFQTRRFLWREYRNIGGLFYAYVNMYELYMATDSEINAIPRYS